MTPEEWYNQGIALYEQGKYEEAVKAFDEAIRIKPEYAEAWYNKGVALGGLGKYEEAIKAYDEAIKSNDTSPSSNLGKLHFELGNLEGASE